MENNRQYGLLDVFRLIAAFLVIAIHTSPFLNLNPEIDFAFSRIIARTAVPFFLMVTGYFVLPQYLFGRVSDNHMHMLWGWIYKTLGLYAAAILLYLPVNVYAGQLQEIHFGDILRRLVFDGTFYHLWYLPSSVLGILLLLLLKRKFAFKTLAGIALVLYTVGLFGDSYYGFISGTPVISTIYDGLFHLFSYTRTGFFYVPVFLIMGAWCSRFKWKIQRKYLGTGFAASMGLMLVEGMLLHRLGVQRHDSMYIMLLPCMFLLFGFLVSFKCKNVKRLRRISTCMYLIHPLIIVIVRYAAGKTHLETVLVNNYLMLYLLVCILTFGFSVIFCTAVEEKAAQIHRKNIQKGRAWIELDRGSLRQNVMTLQRLLPPGCQLMPAIKANAYGHGAEIIARELSSMGVKMFCVACVAEGVELRRHGIKGDILILGYTAPEQFYLLRRYHLIQTVVDAAYARILAAYGRKLRVHLKIDTGMHRLGERCEKSEEIRRIFQYKNLQIEGVFTHLCSDDTISLADRAVTLAQGSAFYKVINQLREDGFVCPKIHVLASYGLLNYPELGGNYARIGIALYGVLSLHKDLQSCPVKLVPVLSLKTRVASVKNIYKGEGAGYGLQYVAEKDTKIAVLSIGYADGIPRALSCGVGHVLLWGVKVPIVGRICMDQLLVEVTDLPRVKEGDIAVLIGKSGQCEITAYDLAEQTGTITNEILSRLGSRLNRIVVY